MQIVTSMHFQCFFSFPILIYLGPPKDITTSADDKGKFMLLNTYNYTFYQLKKNKGFGFVLQNVIFDLPFISIRPRGYFITASTSV